MACSMLQMLVSSQGSFPYLCFVTIPQGTLPKAESYFNQHTLSACCTLLIPCPQ